MTSAVGMVSWNKRILFILKQATATSFLNLIHDPILTTLIGIPRKQVQLNSVFNLLKPTGYVMHQQFNIQQLYVLPTLYLCVLYLSENKQRLVPLTA